MLVQQIISIKKAVILSIFVIDFGHTAVLHQFLNHSIPEVLELNIEVELDIFNVLGGCKDVLEGSIDVRLNLF